MTELPEDVRRLFEGANYAHVATLMPDGAPHSVPLWVALEGDRIAFQTSPDSRKARNLERDPRVAISITDHAVPYAMAVVRGRVAERVDGDAGWAIIDRLAVKYTGQPYPLRTDRVAFLVELDHARAISYG
jgi:PPOX class probable F420-dependent enzyme